MKDATDDIAYAMEVLAKTQGLDFDMYSGCDDNILPFICAEEKVLFQYYQIFILNKLRG